MTGSGMTAGKPRRPRPPEPEVPERDLMRDYLLGHYGGIPRIARGTLASVVAQFNAERAEAGQAGSAP